LVKGMKAAVFEKDFEKYGIPIRADEIRQLTDEQIDEIVKRCFPEKLKMRSLTPEAEVRSHEHKCPYCGDNRYYVTREYVWLVDAYGNETYVPDGGDLRATCLRCRATIDVPWVERENKKVHEEGKRKYNERLRSAGYKKASINDVMEKYGIENFDDLSDIVWFCMFTGDYGDDREECFDELVQDMYDIPAVFSTCVWRACCELKEVGEIERAEQIDAYYEKGAELSKQPCTNLKPMYGVTPTVIIGDEDEYIKIYINGVKIDEEPDCENPYGFHNAIIRAKDKYDKMMAER